MRSESATRRRHRPALPPAPDLEHLASAVTRRHWGRFAFGACVLAVALGLALTTLPGRGRHEASEVELAAYDFAPAETGGVDVTRTWRLLDVGGVTVLAGEVALHNVGASTANVRVQESFPDGADMARLSSDPAPAEVHPASRSLAWDVDVPGGATVSVSARVPAQTGELAPAEALSRWAAAAVHRHNEMHV